MLYFLRNIIYINYIYMFIINCYCIIKLLLLNYYYYYYNFCYYILYYVIILLLLLLLSLYIYNIYNII